MWVKYRKVEGRRFKAGHNYSWHLLPSFARPHAVDIAAAYFDDIPVSHYGPAMSSLPVTGALNEQLPVCCEAWIMPPGRFPRAGFKAQIGPATISLPG